VPGHSYKISSQNGVALIVVLAFVALLAGITVAYLGRALMDRQKAHATVNELRADQLALSALDVITADLKQEIENGSTSSTVGTTTIYTPTSTTNILPQTSGTPSVPPTIANLIRRSITADSIRSPGVSSKASAITSAPADPTNPQKGDITTARWNKHYLIPKLNSDEKSEPVASFTAPDWVLVTTLGAKEFPRWDSSLCDSSDSNFAIGRYAFVIYDEGGLLDVNVAGYPTDASLAATAVATDAPVGGKGLLALADLVPIVSAATIPQQRAAINQLIGWRNYSTAQPGGVFPNFTFTSSSGAAWYTRFVTNNTSGFLQTSATTWRGRTDQAFVNRQELIEYRRTTQFSINALQYMGTFSRELNSPTWGDPATARVTAPFQRRDGSTAQVGDVLFRRFPIAELAWVGPNGAIAPGTASTVQRDFGLRWNGDHWDYCGTSGSTLIGAVPSIRGDQEPDLFQLLAVAKPAATIQQLLTTGACLIDQYDGPGTDPSNMTTRIDFAGPAMPPSTNNSVAWGMENVTPPVPATAPTPRGALILNRAFYNVGEFGYANGDVTTASPGPTPATLDFYSASSRDAAILDFFGVSTAPMRAGVVNLNTRQNLVLSSILSFATATQPSTPLSSVRRNSTAIGIATATNASPAMSRQEIPRLAAQSGLTGGEEIQEVVARSLPDMCQTRTWNLMIDVIAQSGRYPSTATSLSQFIMEGEKRYWMHIAIDRFTGEVIDEQLEAVYE
jgi:Tfp pilus assembly protein PilX